MSYILVIRTFLIRVMRLYEMGKNITVCLYLTNARRGAYLRDKSKFNCLVKEVMYGALDDRVKKLGSCEVY